MRARQSGQPVGDAARQVCRRGGGARGERDEAACQGEDILHPMVHLAEHQFALLLQATPFGDVARDLGRADDSAVLVTDRRYGQRKIDERAILAPPDGFEMLDAASGPNLRQDARLLVQTVFGNEEGDRQTDNLLGGIAEQALGARVPAADAPRKILADDRVVGALDDRRQPVGRVRIVAAEERGTRPAELRGRAVGVLLRLFV